MNLTSGTCYQTLHMPNTGNHVGAVSTTWVKLTTSGFSIDLAICHSTEHGDVPGYEYENRCYFVIGDREFYTSEWSFVGVIDGHFHFKSNTYLVISLVDIKVTGKGLYSIVLLMPPDC